MKKKRILTLICAAAVVLASAPALPVFAETAEESGGATSIYQSENEAGKEIGGETPDGYNWYGFSAENTGEISVVPESDGAVSFAWTDVKNAFFTDGMHAATEVSATDLQDKTYQYAGKLTLGGCGYFGVHGYVNGKELYIVEGWDQVNPAKALSDYKLGVVTVGDADYGIYQEIRKQDDNKSVSVYWCIRLANQFKASDTGEEVRGSLPLGEMLEAMKHYGIRATSCAGLAVFVDSGTNAAAKTSGKAEFTVNRFAKPTVIHQGPADAEYFCESGKTSGYNWSRTQKGDGKSSLIRTGSNGCFISEWTEIDREQNVLFLSGKDLGTLMDFEKISRIDGHYDVQATVNGDAMFGYRASFLVQDGRTNPVTECIIVEGWGTQKPAAADTYHRGKITLDDADYDVYLIPVNADTADQLPVQPGSTAVQQILFVRDESVIHANMNSVAHGDVDMFYALTLVKELGITLPPQSSLQSFDFFAQAWDNSGSLTVKRNDMVIEQYQKSDNKTLQENGVTDDGYYWTHYSDAGYQKSEMETGKDGTFRAEWKDVLCDTLFISGTKYDEEISWDAFTTLQYDYEVELHADLREYYACAGVYGWMQNGRNLIEYSIIDGWIGERPEYSQKIAEIEVDGVKYDILKTVNLTGGTLVGADNTVLTFYRIIRQENLLDDKKGGKFSNSVNVAEILKGCAEYGKTMGYLSEVAVFAETWGGYTPVNEGTAVVTKNKLTAVRSTGTETQPETKPNVKGDANCDGVLDVSDAVLIARVVTEDVTAEITRQGIMNGDADGDSQLTGNDITMLLKAIAKQIKL